MSNIKDIAVFAGWGSLICMFLIGLMEGYFSVVIEPLIPFTIFFGLVFALSMITYFYLEGKEVKKKQELNYILLTLILIMYATSQLEWVALIIAVLPYLIGRYRK